MTHEPARYVPVPAHFCPVHGTALCPEMYLLQRDGTPKPTRIWNETMRCGQAVQLYRRVHEEETEAADARREGE